MKRIANSLFFLVISIFGNSQIPEEPYPLILNKTSIFQENINIYDGEVYDLTFDFIRPHSKEFSSWYPQILEKKFPPNSLIIKSFEDEISTLEILKSYALDNLPDPIYSPNEIYPYSTNKYLIYKENPFPNYKIDRWAGDRHDALKEKIIQAWDYGSNYLLPFFHRLMQSASARKELYQYVKNTFSNASQLIPKSVKKRIMKICDMLMNFLMNYKTNKAKYIALSKKENFVEEFGYCKSFLFRRIENDKIPVSELSQFITEVKKSLEIELNNSNEDYYFKININESDLVICDGINSKYSIFSKNSNKKLDIEYLESIKCIKSTSNNYLISFDGKKILYNNKLEVINRD